MDFIWIGYVNIVEKMVVFDIQKSSLGMPIAGAWGLVPTKFFQPP